MAKKNIWEERSQEKADLLRQNVPHEGLVELAFLYGRAVDNAQITGETTKNVYLRKLRLRANYDLRHVPQHFQTYFSAKVAYKMIEEGKYTSNPEMPHIDEVTEARSADSLDKMVDAEDRRHFDLQYEIPLTSDHVRIW